MEPEAPPEPDASEPARSPRWNWLTCPEAFILNQACRPLVDAFGWCVYHVGSSLKRRDYRDVDVRAILPDAEFDRLFPGIARGPQYDAFWSLVCSSISVYLAKQTGLPIDFQIQKQSVANAEYPKEDRNPIGVFIERKKDDPE